MDSSTIESITKLSGQELYDQGLVFKQNKDWSNYAVYMTMAANYDNELAKQDIEDVMNGKFRMLQNHKHTMSFYEATQQWSYSTYYLGHMYFHGRGVKRDFVKSQKYYETAANQGNTRAMHCLGRLYSRGCPGIKKDLELSRKYYEQASLSSWRSIYCLGLAYDQGTSVPKDYNKAAELYKQAVSKGGKKAIEKLRNLYATTDLKDNTAETINYFSSIDQVNHLQKIYKFDTYIMDLLRENTELAKKNNSIRNNVTEANKKLINVL